MAEHRAAVSIFSGTGLCTGRIDLGARGTGLGTGLGCELSFEKILFCVLNGDRLTGDSC